MTRLSDGRDGYLLFKSTRASPMEPFCRTSCLVSLGSARSDRDRKQDDAHRRAPFTGSRGSARAKPNARKDDEPATHLTGSERCGANRPAGPWCGRADRSRCWPEWRGSMWWQMADRIRWGIVGAGGVRITFESVVRRKSRRESRALSPSASVVEWHDRKLMALLGQSPARFIVP